MFRNSTVQQAVLQCIHRVMRTLRVRSASAFMAAIVLAGASLFTAPTVLAQGGGRVAGDAEGNRERKALTPQQLEERRKMIAEFEQRVDNLIRTRLQATDEQMVKLRALKKRFDVDKNQLFRDEGELRKSMRVELTSASPSDAKLTELLGKWPALQRRRIEIEEKEQNELAKFLQPVQRARFFAFQDELRRARQDTQWGRGERGAPGMQGMRNDSAGGRNGGFRGGRGGRPPSKDTVRQ